mmetsp:Transcript_12628/g.17348  ORF Transcript_12628/g.17348 Transcript_12628/m.17348 type:complete len:578 (+) Transcript_12628:45-1778(+)
MKNLSSPLQRRLNEHFDYQSTSEKNSVRYTPLVEENGKKSPLRESYNRFSSGSAFRSVRYEDQDVIDSPLRSATSVIGAFRELQAKTKAVEVDRLNAIKERDDLRKALMEKQRFQSMIRGKLKIDNTEYLLNMRSSNDRLQRENDALKTSVEAQEDIQRSMQRGLIAQRTLQSNLQDDIMQMQSTIQRVQKQNATLKIELDAVNSRHRSTQNVSISSPERYNRQYRLLLETVDSLQSDILTARTEKAHQDNKAASLQAYIELMLKINGDLLDTIIQREKSKAKVIRMAENFVPPPRYSWPKEIPSVRILDVIADAAAAKATAAAENAARETSTSAVHSLVRSLSPGRRFKYDAHSDTMDLMAGSYSNDSRQRGSSQSRSMGATSNGDSFHTTLMNNYFKMKNSRSEDASVDKDKKAWVSHEDGDGEMRRSRSGSNSGTRMTARRRSRSVDRGIAVNDSIASATRMAAAAEAAALTASMVMSRSPSPNIRRHPLESVSTGESSKLAFIPANSGSEFNIVANVSKASRAAQQLNASLASKVKSIHNDGSGDIYDEVPQIHLEDMHRQLAVRKKQQHRAR